MVSTKETTITIPLPGHDPLSQSGIVCSGYLDVKFYNKSQSALFAVFVAHEKGVMMHYDGPDFRSFASQSISCTLVVRKKEGNGSDRSGIVKAHEMLPCLVRCDETGPLSRFSNLQTRFKGDGDDQHHS